MPKQQNTKVPKDAILLRRKHVATLLQVSETTVASMDRHGLKPVHIGACVLYKRSDVEKFTRKLKE